MSPIAYSVPLTAASLAKLTATQWNASVRDNIIFLANPPACRVYHGTTQSITDSSLTALAFNSERFDPTGMHDNVTNNSRITFATAGVYVVSFSGEMNAATDYVAIIAQLRKNGTTTLASTHVQANSGTSYGPTITVTTVDKFAAADYVQALVYQDNVANAARNLNAAPNYSPEFSAVWVGLG